MLYDFKDTLPLRCSNLSDVENTDCVTNIKNFFFRMMFLFVDTSDCQIVHDKAQRYKLMRNHSFTER